MADPFAIALGAIFAAPWSISAEYEPNSCPPATIRIIKTEFDEDTDVGGIIIRAGTILIEVMRSDAPNPAEGETFTVGDEVLEILGEPKLDREGVTYTCEVAPGL